MFWNKPFLSVLIVKENRYLQEDSRCAKRGLQEDDPGVRIVRAGLISLSTAALTGAQPIVIEILGKSDAGVPGDPPARRGPPLRSPHSALVGAVPTAAPRRSRLRVRGRCGALATLNHVTYGPAQSVCRLRR